MELPYLIFLPVTRRKTLLILTWQYFCQFMGLDTLPKIFQYGSVFLPAALLLHDAALSQHSSLWICFSLQTGVFKAFNHFSIIYLVLSH